MRLTRTATLLFASLALPATLTALPAMAQTTGSLMSSEHTVMVGGAPMYPSKNIVQNAVNSKDHTTLVAAVKAAGLVDTLEGPGPFTVFAPTKRVRSHVRPSLSVVTASIFNTGHHAFFDRIEGGGTDGWRLHFFCRGPATVSVLYDVGVGVCGPGSSAKFDAEQFVMHRLGQLERTGRLAAPDGWWDWD
jgi:hypothetical protein